MNLEFFNFNSRLNLIIILKKSFDMKFIYIQIREIKNRDI